MSHSNLRRWMTSETEMTQNFEQGYNLLMAVVLRLAIPQRDSISIDGVYLGVTRVCSWWRIGAQPFTQRVFVPPTHLQIFDATASGSLSYTRPPRYDEKKFRTKQMQNGEQEMVELKCGAK